MSARVASGSYGHSATRIGSDLWRISWCVEFKHRGSRLRHPRTFERVTDNRGAARFAKRWRFTLPGSTPEAATAQLRRTMTRKTLHDAAARTRRRLRWSR